MKKTAMIMTAAVLATSFCGCEKKDSNSGDSSKVLNTKLYDSEGSTKYSTLNYDVEISSDFILESPEEAVEKYSYKYEFSSDYIQRLDVCGYGELVLDNEYNVQQTYESMLDNDSVEDASMDIEEYDGRKICSYSYTCDDVLNEGFKVRITNMSIAYEGRELQLEAQYRPENDERAIGVMKDIIKTAEYTSDYRIPTEEQEYSDELFSIKYDPKYEVSGSAGKDDEKSEDDDELGEFIVTYRISQNDEEYFTKVKLAATKKEKNKDYHRVAYDLYDTYKEKENTDLVKFSNVDKVEEDILGFAAEKVSFEMSMKTLEIITKQDVYVFEKGDIVYQLSARYPVGYEPSTSAIDEIINNIVIK